jgi:hypothetical protein
MVKQGDLIPRGGSPLHGIGIIRQSLFQRGVRNEQKTNRQ